MKKNLYVAKCSTFNEILLDLACGNVVSCSPDSLELCVKDYDSDSHIVKVSKETIKLLVIIIDDYIKNL